MKTKRELALLCKRARKEKSDHSNTEVEFLHDEDEDFHYIAIRGTEVSKFFSGRGYIDMIRDLAIWGKSINDGIGHAGFVHGWHTIRDEVKAAVAHDYVKPVVLTGHSLGGAIAIVGAYGPSYRGIFVHSAVTFGAPRCLVKPKITLHLKRLRRIVKEYQHPYDPVPTFMKWTRYDHISPVLMGDKPRWWKRKIKYHGIDTYIELFDPLSQAQKPTL